MAAFSLLVLLLLAVHLGVAVAEHSGANRANPLLEPALASYVPASSLSGRLTIAGSDTMQRLMAMLAAEFTSRHPDVKMAVEGGGSSAGIREFIIGYSSQRRGEKSRDGHDGASQTTVLASSRELTAKELAAFSARYGYEPVVIPVAMDAVAVYVHRDNPIQGLTVDQIDAIFSSTRKRGLPAITTWGQLGLQNGWDHQPIHLYGRDRDSGTHDFFELVALDGGKLREDVNLKPGSASEILAIAGDPLGIGFAGIGFQGSAVRVVPLAGHGGGQFVMPSVESVRNQTYPLSRFLYLYVNQAPNRKFDPVLFEFLKFVNSQEGQNVVANAKFYPLPLNQVSKNLALINGGTVTAAFLPGNMN